LLLAGALAQAGTTADRNEPAPSILEELHIQKDPGPLNRSMVQDLVLDQEGNVLVAYRGERGIWRINLAGDVAFHARIPEGVNPGDGGPEASLCMSLDPATGDLHVRDASTTWRVTPAGEVTALAGEPPGPPVEPRQESKLEAKTEPPEGLPRRWTAMGGSRPSWRGLFHLSLLGLAALADPALLGDAAGPGASDDRIAQINRYTAQATAGLGQLDPVCGASLLAGRSIAPCDRNYRSQVLTQVAAIQGQMLKLDVDPAILGPGQCLPGESLKAAKARIALGQSDNLVAYDALNAEAAALTAQLDRDGFVVWGVGQGLLGGQLAAAGTGGGTTELEAIAAFTVKEVGTSLLGAGDALQAVGAIYGKVAGVALSLKAKYQRYANNQTQAVLDRCTHAAAFPQPGMPSPLSPWPASPLTSPVPALEDALIKLTDGCVLAAQHDLDLPVCSQDSLAEVNLRNGTLGDLFQGIACLSAGVLLGQQSICPNAPLADSRARSDTFAFFDQFFGEISAAAGDAFASGFALGAAARGVDGAGLAADLAENTPEATALLVAATSLDALGDAIIVEAYELTRIGFLSRRWQADVTWAFNADSRAQLEEKEAKARPGAGSSSTGTGSPQDAGQRSSSGSILDLRSSGVSSTGEDGSGPGSSTGSSSGTPAPASGNTGASAPTSSTASEPRSASAATRTRPLTLGDLVQLFRPRPASDPSAHEEF
jgi:hypothetical protein